MLLDPPQIFAQTIAVRQTLRSSCARPMSSLRIRISTRPSLPVFCACGSRCSDNAGLSTSCASRLGTDDERGASCPIPTSRPSNFILARIRHARPPFRSDVCPSRSRTVCRPLSGWRAYNLRRFRPPARLDIKRAARCGERAAIGAPLIICLPSIYSVLTRCQAHHIMHGQCG